MLDNKNFWLVVDYIRWRFPLYERAVGSKELFKTTRFLMKEYRRRKSYYGDTIETYDDFIREYVKPFMKNLMEDMLDGQKDNLLSAEKYVSYRDQQARSSGSSKSAQAVQREAHLS